MYDNSRMLISLSRAFLISLCVACGCATTQPTTRENRQSSPNRAAAFEWARGIVGVPSFGTGVSDEGVVVRPSPNAYAQGLRQGDWVVSWGGEPFVPKSQGAWIAERDQLLQEGKPLQIQVERGNKLIDITIAASRDAWADAWFAAIAREDWKSALEILDREANADTALTRVNYLHARWGLVEFEELRTLGATGGATLSARNALASELLELGKVDPKVVMESRTSIVETIDYARAIGAVAVADDLRARLSAHDDQAKATLSEAVPRKAQPVSSGTGFIVTNDGWILTAFHVVEGAFRVTVVMPDGQSLQARVVRTQPALDVAVLEVGQESNEYLPIPSELSCEPGDPVFTIGFPVTQVLGIEPKFTDGAISSLSGIGGDASVMQVTVPIQPGNSGGALVNRQGEAVGIVVSSAAPAAFLRAAGTLPQSVNFAVRSDLARPLLRDRRRTSLPLCESREEAIARVRRVTVIVLAER